MAKRLVVCCDGTWNVPDERPPRRRRADERRQARPGRRHGRGDSGQELFYEAGVGTTPDERILGGAFGYGLSRNVRSCYRFLAQKYEPGRRALPVRVQPRRVHGAQPRRADPQLRDLEAGARRPGRRGVRVLPRPHVADPSERARVADLPQDVLPPSRTTSTSSACGTRSARSGSPPSCRGGSGSRSTCTGGSRSGGSTTPGSAATSSHAYQALAIDEEREPFRPTLWDEDDTAQGQTLEQVWFAGVHTEVGGGSTDPSLSDIALLWMVEKARACGLVFEPGQLAPGGGNGAGAAVAPNYAAPIVDSRKGIYEALRPYHRLTHADVAAAPGQSIASSARRRFTERVDDYSPRGFEEYAPPIPPSRPWRSSPARRRRHRAQRPEGPPAWAFPPSPRSGQVFAQLPHAVRVSFSLLVRSPELRHVDADLGERPPLPVQAQRRLRSGARGPSPRGTRPSPSRSASSVIHRSRSRGPIIVVSQSTSRRPPLPSG